MLDISGVTVFVTSENVLPFTSCSANKGGEKAYGNFVKLWKLSFPMQSKLRRPKPAFGIVIGDK